MQQLEDAQIRRIFAEASIGEIESIRKIDIGFSNDIYSIDDRYILKACRSDEGGDSHRRDVYLCSLLQGSIPAPRIILSDTSKTLTDRFYMIYPMIPGANLYARWHLFDSHSRREIVRQICWILRTINNIPYEGFAREFGIDTSRTWRDTMISRISVWLEKVDSAGYLSTESVGRVRAFLRRTADVLLEQRMALVYFDPHFDNILVSGDHVSGIVDFERVEVASIDYVFRLLRRMVRTPRKYASYESEDYVRPEDYSELPSWFAEFYPELFDFKDLDARIDIYSIESCLEDIYYYPEGMEAREELNRYTDQKSGRTRTPGMQPSNTGV